MNALGDMFGHHAWATLTLIDACAALPPEKLREAVPGTYGTILNTFIHLVGADQRYLDRMDEGSAEPPIALDQDVPLAELRRRFEAQSRRWEALLARGDALDVTMPARGEWPETPHAQDLLMLQAIHHGNDHRTHICTALTVLGVEPPDIDGWSYWAAKYH